MKIIINILLWFWILIGIVTFGTSIYIFINGWLNKQKGFWLDGSFFLAISLVSVIMYYMNKRRMALYVKSDDKEPKN